MKQSVVILVGTPGSGKSTLAKEFTDHVRISQDVLGSRQNCINECHKHLSSGKSVIIDRTNINRQQRGYWTNIANYYGITNVHCIVLELDPEECIHRISHRVGHETISEHLSIDEKRKIVYNFHKSFEMPSLNEGFKTITITKG